MDERQDSSRTSGIMNIIFVSSLLGAFLLQAASSEESPKVRVLVFPEGSNIYLDESVLLLCFVESNSTSEWSYRWFRHKSHPPTTPNPRHLVSGDRYFITTVTREDEGSYECQAERRERNISSVILRMETDLRVKGVPAPSLKVSPDSRQMFRGERFSVHCPSSLNSSGWRLRRFPQGHTAGRRGSHTDLCSPLGGAVGAGSPVSCVFTAGRESSGLYWCEGAQGRSSAVNISVSYGPVILRTPVSPVVHGGTVLLTCQYWTENKGRTIFYKNGAEIMTSMSSISQREVKMRIENVTLEDEGFYRCSSADRRMESLQSWLSVRPDQGNVTLTDGTGTSSGSWTWVLVLCLLLLLIIPLSVWLIRHYRYQMFCTRSCWPVLKEEPPPVGLPVTKQDTTEVQWDLSWMEMSNLLDKQSFSGT